MKIGSVDTGERVLIVAEVGNNHEGDPEVARELVRRAADSGAHAVKFQTFRASGIVRARDEARFRQLSSYELEPAVVVELAELAHSLGLLVMSTPLDLDSVELLEPLVDAYKVASGDNDFFPLLERVGGAGKPVIVSTGLVDVGGVQTAKTAVEAQGAEVAVLHAVTAYPAPAEAVNLAAIPTLARELRCTVGYSDHTLGNEACVAAVAVGARIVEKHFTLDHDHSDFRDHKLSADPGELRRLVERVALVETLLGSPEKAMQAAEAELAPTVRRSIAAARDLPRGHVLQQADLAWLRPRDGLTPGQEGRLLGRALRHEVAMGESILEDDVT
ncbi:MAG: N-acetylneuraminate synthase family protein [Thermoleophilaceae bacterium]